MNENEASVPPENASSPTPTPEKGWLQETLELFFIALLVVLPIRLFVANPFIVSGTSMVPTFENGDYLIVDELTYRFEMPKRGEVVVFKYPKDPSKYFIKRIIGLPGETVKIERGTVTVADGETVTLREPYVSNHSEGSGTYKLGQSEYFVLGDNRPASSDSRVWGPLPRKNIVGRAFLRVYPPSHFGLFPGLAAY